MIDRGAALPGILHILMSLKCKDVQSTHARWRGVDVKGLTLTTSELFTHSRLEITRVTEKKMPA